MQCRVYAVLPGVVIRVMPPGTEELSKPSPRSGAWRKLVVRQTTFARPLLRVKILHAARTDGVCLPRQMNIKTWGLSPGAPQLSQPFGG
eukprot:scaffold40870_cov60-Phaeocystis_antarctica.AAC.3